MLTPRHIDIYNKYYEDILIPLAFEARKKGDSHRGFKVGCALLVYDRITGLYWIFAGWNIKKAKNSVKYCAEKHALDKALKFGDNWDIVAVVVVGMPQQDSESGLYSTTLPPCGDCRRMLQGFPGTHDNTIILRVHAGGGIRVQQTFHELLTEHSR